MDPKPRFVTYLITSVLIVALAVQTSDIATIRARELSGVAGFEYPALARALYLVERACAPSLRGIALVNAALGVAAAIAIGRSLRIEGGDASLWMASPTLLLAGVNVDTITALLILMALRSWRRGKVAEAGAWVGLGAAFKLAPVVLLFPMAGASDRRGAARLWAAAAATWLAANLPYALASPDAWRFPYEFASRRPDGWGTIWAALGLGVRATNLASALTLGILGSSVALAVGRRKLRPETGAALALLALLATSKLWQPHYLLWALPALALAGAPTRPVRALEVANLACFFVLWRQLPPATAGLWLWPVAAARMAALAVVAVGLIRRDLDRGRTGP